MKTQTQYLPMLFEVDRARFLALLLAETEAAYGQATHSTNPIARVEYKGYRLTASTGSVDGDLYPANLLVERPGNPAHAFHALDYFYDAFQAVCYAEEWGRLWVDSNE